MFSKMRTGAYKSRSTTKAAFVFLLLAAVCGLTSSATFGKRPASGATADSSLSSKRQKTGPKVMEPAFANAGQKTGVEIWRIEDFKPVAYPKKDYGKFYEGDSYIILNTNVLKNGKKSWDIHFWLGSQTTQDEAGAAAILTVQLDEQLGGDPVQYREIQDHESQKFLSLFKNGVRYESGGVKSGFKHVDANAFEKRLFQVKGARNVRVKQVSPSISSMNKGDCFILDVGRDIYVYVGKKSKRVEKLKAIGAANQIRDQDHAGKSKITIVDEFSPESDYIDYFNALGEGSADQVPDETAGGDDSAFENSQQGIVTLYKVSDASGSLQVTPVAQKPLESSLLDPNDCFILDTTDANIFVWVGKKCTDKERKESMKRAEDFLTSKKYPKWTQIQRIIQGAEPAAFTQYFKTWQGTGEKTHRLVRSASSEKWEPRLFHAQIPDGASKWKVEEVFNFDQEDLNEDDVMLLDNGTELFIWIGEGASKDEIEKSKTLAKDYLKKLGVDVNVPVKEMKQGRETGEFKNLFVSWDPQLWNKNKSKDLRDFVK